MYVCMHACMYIYIYIYIRWYDIIILLNSVFHMLQFQNAPVCSSASQIAAQPVNVTTEQTRWFKQTKLSMLNKIKKILLSIRVTENTNKQKSPQLSVLKRN